MAPNHTMASMARPFPGVRMPMMVRVVYLVLLPYGLRYPLTALYPDRCQPATMYLTTGIIHRLMLMVIFRSISAT